MPPIHDLLHRKRLATHASPGLFALGTCSFGVSNRPLRKVLLFLAVACHPSWSRAEPIASDPSRVHAEPTASDPSRVHAEPTASDPSRVRDQPTASDTAQTHAGPTQKNTPLVLRAGRATVPGSLSQYERDILATVLRERHLELEAHPEEKGIEAVEVEPLDVFEAADPAPGWLNWFHSTTRSAVIEREVLLRTGQLYDQRLVDESARNLRKLKPLSLVLIVPVRARDSKRVRLLVITKDVWSLRVDTAYSSRNYGIERLALQPSEINLFGTHLALAARYEYDV